MQEISLKISSFAKTVKKYEYGVIIKQCVEIDKYTQIFSKMNIL